MLLRAVIEGNGEEVIDRERVRIAHALQAAVTGYAEEVKTELRDDVRASGMGNGERLPTTWQVKHFPGRPSRTLEPASLVYSKAPRIIDAFERGVTIRSRRGGLILVPNSEVWPRGRVTGTATGGGGRSDTFAAGVRRFGPLQFIPNKGKPGGRYIARVAANKSPRGGFRKPNPGQTADATVVVFWAVPEARLPRLLSGAAIRAKVRREAAGKIEGRFRQALVATDAPA